MIEEDIFDDEDDDDDDNVKKKSGNKKRRQATIEEYFPGKIKNTDEPTFKKKKVHADLTSNFKEFSKIRR